MKKNIFYFVIVTQLTLFPFYIHAQNLRVESVRHIPNSMAARSTQRNDGNGKPGALLQIYTSLEIEKIKGNYIGSDRPEKKGESEKWFWLTEGSKDIDLFFKNQPPLSIRFEDYGINAVEGNEVYEIIIVAGDTPNTAHSPYNSVTFTVTPATANAIIHINGKDFYTKKGTLTLQLPYNKYEYTVSASGYRSEKRSFFLDDKEHRYQIKLKPQEGNTNVAMTPNSKFVSNSQNAKKQTFTVNGVTFGMIRVEGGTFQMGGTSEQGSDVANREKPVRQVSLSSYYIGETEVTQALWEAVMGSNPSYYKGAKKPVERVSWNDCQTFIQKLTQLTGRNFRLPTEAEWEYAARGGNKSRGYKYSGSNNINDVAWYTETTKDKGTCDAKTRQANELGLYDMSGNVWEWCQDWYGSYGSSSQTNPTGAPSGSLRVLRGGCWYYIAWDCRVSSRYYLAPVRLINTLGLRLAL